MKETCLNPIILYYSCDCFKGWLNDYDEEHCDIKDNSTVEGERICQKGWIGEWCQDECVNK